jgi:copper chaperone CopZ
MTSTRSRIIRLAHSLPGRTRLRLPWLRESRALATELADQLADLDGMTEVSVSMRSGSVLCLYDPSRLTEERIVTAVRRHTKVAIVLRPGERDRAEALRGVAEVRATGSRLGEAMTAAVKGIDADVRAATDGLLDLGALAGFGFLAAGAAEVATSKTLPAPPWFNLAWWAFRTFTMFESPSSEPTPPGADVSLPTATPARRSRARRALAAAKAPRR